MSEAAYRLQFSDRALADLKRLEKPIARRIPDKLKMTPTPCEFALCLR